MAETIRYNCVVCGHQIKDRPSERKALARGGKFIRMNPSAPRHRVSFHCLMKDEKAGKTYRQLWQVFWVQSEGVKPMPGMMKCFWIRQSLIH